MLKKPSTILHEANVQLPREYAYKVDRSLHQIDQHTQLFDASFVNPADAVTLESSVRRHFNNVIQCSGMESCILLPPLFIRSQEDAVVRLSSQFVLVMFRDGPVVPVLCISNQSPTPKPKLEPLLVIDSQSSSSSPPCAVIHVEKPPHDVTDDSNTTHIPEQAFVLQRETSQPRQHIIIPEAATSLASIAQSQNQQQHAKLALTAEDERRYVEMMTKTPIAAVCSLQTSAAREVLSRDDQLQKYMQMKQSIDALYSQRMQHEQVLANPHISSTTERVLKESLARKCTYIQQHLSKIATERARLIDEQQTNEVTRRVLLACTDSDPKWHMDIEAERKHLQTCIDLLETANPNMSV